MSVHRMGLTTQKNHNESTNIIGLPKFVLDPIYLAEEKLFRFNEVIKDLKFQKSSQIFSQSKQFAHKIQHNNSFNNGKRQLSVDLIQNLDSNSINYENTHQMYAGKYFHKKINKTRNISLQNTNFNQKKLTGQQWSKQASSSYKQIKNQLIKALEEKTKFVTISGKKNNEKDHNLVILTKKSEQSAKKELKVSQFLNRQKQQMKMNQLKKLSQETTTKKLSILNPSLSKSQRKKLSHFFDKSSSLRSISILNKTILVQPADYYNKQNKNMVVHVKAKQFFKIDAMRARLTYRNLDNTPRSTLRRVNKSQCKGFKCVEKEDQQNLYRQLEENKEKTKQFGKKIRFNEIIANDKYCGSKLNQNRNLLPQIRGWDYQDQSDLK